MKILLIDCKDELIIHNLPVNSSTDARKVENWWKDQEKARGHEIDRIMIRGGTCEIMNREDPIPSGKEVIIPPRPA